MDADHEILLFHMAIRSLSKGNMLSQVYEMWKKVKLFQPTFARQPYLRHRSLSFHTCMYRKIRVVVSKSSRGNVASFSKLDAALEKNKVDLDADAELKAEIEAHLQSFKQEFERYFPDLANTDLPKWKLAKNPF